MIPSAVALIVFLGGSTFAFAGPLHDAASAGDVEKVGRLLDQGAEIDARSDRGEIPLTLAILSGQDAVVELLTERGAAIDGRNAGGFTALHAAAYVGEIEAAEHSSAREPTSMIGTTRPV